MKSNERITSAKGLIEWIIDQHLRVRPPRLQRSAGFVILAGVGLLVLSFNDLVFEYVLKPAGFNRTEITAPIVGLSLVFLGLAALVLDSLSGKIPSRVFQQDLELFRRIRSILPWDAIDASLNHLHNHWCWKAELESLQKLRWFMQDEAHRFVDRELEKARSVFQKEVEGLGIFIAYHFFPEEVPDFQRFLFLPNISEDRTGIYNPKFAERESVLQQKIANLERSYIALVRVARSRGMIQSEDPNTETP